MRVFAFHLLNDFSGSPKVLMQLLKGWEAEGLELHLATCSGREGFLSHLKGVQYHTYWYRFVPNRWLRFIYLMISQGLVILKFWTQIQKQDIVYVNTVLPFGAAILGKLKGCKVIYHIHETSIKPKIFKDFLFKIVGNTAHEVIYVSHYLAEQERVAHIKKHILYNAIESGFLKQAKDYPTVSPRFKNVLMVCSLKEYKGVREFVQLAIRNQSFDFQLVLNADPSDIDRFFEREQLPVNLQLTATQKNIHPFYQWADVVLNLSRPDGWVETFGLTAIEAMAYGLPVIVPPIGGIAELVDDGVNGYQVDSRDSEELDKALAFILQDHEIYRSMSNQALQRINDFDESTFVRKSIEIIS